MRGLRFEGAPPAPGTRVIVEGADVGRVTSVADSARFGPIGLAILRREVAEGATGDAAGAALRVVALPFG